MKACEPAATEQLSALACWGQDMGYQHLLYAVDDRVATITPNRPERHYALSEPLVDRITEQFAPYE
jgi:hypothetical protein